MKDVPLAGLLLGMAAVVLATPLLPASSWWILPLIGGGVSGLSAYAISHGVNNIPGASPKAVAALATILVVGAAGVGVVALGSRLDGVQAVVVIVTAHVAFRLVVATVDRFTPSFTVSLLAGLAGTLVFAAAVPLLALAHAGLSAWACIGIGAGAGYLEGVLIGATLKPLFDSDGGA
ncbi:hypothetical protein [Saccharothrix deserti]|uniref:hypothetical protein n=1 Tax=Saccharothrix deserti TaxID=2593674 RepID=UPI00131B3035|nr:hypothetical protein [Saccharothrix deserti]